jgi:hypothetical protein
MNDRVGKGKERKEEKEKGKERDRGERDTWVSGGL